MNENIHPRQGISHLSVIFKELGISDVVICPGSRNAPIILAFVKSKKYNLYSIVDERSAGYFAIGLMQAMHKPVAVICTSGTAVLNLMPSVAEAFYQRLPLIVITADRPAEWIDMGDGQTIRQTNVFAHHVKQSIELPIEIKTKEDLWYNDRIICEAINQANSIPKGPVHINVPLREPLYSTIPDPLTPKIIHTTSCYTSLNDLTWQNIYNKWEKYQNKIIVAGFQYSNQSNTEHLQNLLNNILEQYNILIFAENLSNLNHPNIIFDPDRFLASINDSDKKKLQPDLLISFGNTIVSKRLKNYLRNYKPKEHWIIDRTNINLDTFQALTHNITINIEDFLEKILSSSVKKIENKLYQNYFINLHHKIKIKHDEIIKTLPFSDITALHMILKTLPENINVHFSNSMPIRYSQFFVTQPTVKYFCNRCTSGIDGCVSTAIGMSCVSDNITLLITGDLAFLYDSNGLWNHYKSDNLKIIVLNNQGGNIFQLIDTSAEIEAALEFFVTPHNIRLKDIAKTYSLTYFYAENKEDLNKYIKHFWQCNSPSIFEILTDKETNTNALKSYLKQLHL